MNVINVVVCVDVEGALSSGSLQENVYLVDTNKYIGSWQQGTSALHTVCQDGQVVSWWVAPVDPGSAADISGFSGPMIDAKTCVPRLNPLADPAAWAGQVQARGAPGTWPYTLALSLSGKAMSFTATLKVV